MKKDNLSDQYQVNDEIRAREVRIVGEGFEPKVVSLREALKIADDMELDLVLISPNAVPPVCRIVDFSKFIYQLSFISLRKSRRRPRQSRSRLTSRRSVSDPRPMITTTTSN